MHSRVTDWGKKETQSKPSVNYFPWLLAPSPPNWRKVYCYRTVRDGSGYQNRWIIGKVPRGGKLIFKPKINIVNFGPLYKALKRAFRKKCSFVQFSTWIRAGPKRKVVLEKVEGGDWGVKVLNLLLSSIFFDLKTDKKQFSLDNDSLWNLLPSRELWILHAKEEKYCPISLSPAHNSPSSLSLWSQLSCKIQMSSI